jgi:hypothetical protein
MQLALWPPLAEAGLCMAACQSMKPSRLSGRWLAVAVASSSWVRRLSLHCMKACGRMVRRDLQMGKDREETGRKDGVIQLSL